MKRNNISKKLTALVLSATILCGSAGMDVNAAKLTKTMNWVAYAVTITTQTDKVGDENYSTLFVYDKKGSCFKSGASSSVSSAVVVIKNSKTKSALGVHYAKDSAGKTYGYKKIKKNKGTNYSLYN